MRAVSHGVMLDAGGGGGAALRGELITPREHTRVCCGCTDVKVTVTHQILHDDLVTRYQVQAGGTGENQSRGTELGDVLGR